MPGHANLSPVDMVNLIYIGTEPRASDFAPTDRVRLVSMGLALEVEDRMEFTPLGERIAQRLSSGRHKADLSGEPAKVIALFPPQSQTIRRPKASP